MSSSFTIQDLQSGKIQFTNDCIWLQYTGVKDKNGEDIFEGDIVLGDKGDRFVVFYDLGTASFSLEFLNNRKFRDSFLDDSEEYEIIGNIYETPELLEEK